MKDRYFLLPMLDGLPTDPRGIRSIERREFS